MKTSRSTSTVPPRLASGARAGVLCSGIVPFLAWAPGFADLLPIDLTNPNLLLILIGVVVVETIIILFMWTALFARRDGTRSSSEEDGKGNLAALYSKALTGSLDRFSVGEVLQFLNSIRETGILDILDDRVSIVHRLLIANGDIIDAYNGDKRGERAVQQILQCREGTFTFIRGDLPSNERVIEKPTMTLLMEAYQQRDENNDIELDDRPLFVGQG